MPRPLAVALAAAFSATTLAQLQPQPQPAPQSQPQNQPQTINIDDLPPPLRLGARVEQVRRGWPSLSTLVIVPDEASYIEAIAQWAIPTPANPNGCRYPVLIDDGTLQAREDIARFVRAFQPKSVLRWSVASDPALKPAELWPATRAQREAALTAAMARSWNLQQPADVAPPNITTQAQLASRWSRFGVTPPGVVVADPMDRAWPAALALAAGRLQPILWIDAASLGSTDPNASLTHEQFGRLHERIRTELKALAIPYAQLGDAIEAITLCTHTPGKVQSSPNDILATTDLLGRTWDPAHAAKGERFAWAGQIFGTESQAAYRAMCALFLGTTSAWLFNGYPAGEPWNQFDSTAAAKILKDAGFPNVTVEDRPKQSERQWRVTTSSSIDASLIMVNTKGMLDTFELEPGRCTAGDVPTLRVPSIVYFVHSFSAAAPARRDSIAARFLERGAYAYFGSTHEPFLQAFVPTPKAAARLLNGMPLAVALRPDQNSPTEKPDAPASPPAWRLTLLGDPLIVLGPAASLAPDAIQAKGPPLKRAAELQPTLALALKDSDFERALITLTLLGRDEDAAKLLTAMLTERPTDATPAVAAAGILPLHRTRRPVEVAQAYAKLDNERAADPILRDALWAALYPTITTLDAPTLSLLRANIRVDQPGRDAGDIAQAVARAFNRESAVDMLNQAIAKSPTEPDRNEAKSALDRVRGRR